MATVITGSGPAELRGLSVKLRQADPHLRRQLRRRLRDEMEPVADRVRDSIMSMPSHHDGTLRREIAGTVRVSVGAVSLAVVADGRRMPPGKENLVVYTDRAQGWAHPVYARGPRFTMVPSVARKYQHLDVLQRPLVHKGAWAWVRQTGKPEWFEAPVYLKARDLRRACQQAMDDTARMLG